MCASCGLSMLQPSSILRLARQLSDSQARCNTKVQPPLQAAAGRVVDSKEMKLGEAL